ncbi:Chloroperoxidase [Pterulicium gracile]|uniref:Chloroperoxidase n=1 Tax=Pterulicium gracile TaxID=1884261 RepID=A0A5C3QH36_9AGAR|nr:Chloroperoxidase [Pterula gracilis]
MAPGPTDMRGPCPGLNTLANHGYVPRNGIVSVDHIMNAAQVRFNLGSGFSKAVASFAVLSRGNPMLNLISIGGESALVHPLPGNIDGIPGGLSKHGRFEGDVSMTRRDAAFGDCASFQPSMFANLLTYAEKLGQDGIVTPEVFVNYRFDLFLQSISKNPKMTFHEGRRAFGYGEAGLTLDLMPDGPAGSPPPPCPYS